VADGINVRMSTGQPETRGGVVTPIHLNPGLWTNVQGIGLYSDPNGSEWIVVADAQKVYFVADGASPRELDLPAGHTMGACEIVQAFGDLLFLRGKDVPNMVWEGNWTKPLKLVTASPVPPEESDYLDPIPGVEFGMVMADRFFFPVERDTVGWSDLLDYTRYDKAFSTARFNRGEDDVIIALSGYQGNRLVVFKTQSIYYMYNVQGDMSGVVVDRLPARIGCVARRSVAEVGGDLMWLGDRGVYRLSQTEEGSIRSVPTPVSQAIEGYMARINWDVAAQASACVVGNTYLLSIPIDNATRNNAVLVYDIPTQRWQGLDYYGVNPTLPPVIVTGGGVGSPVYEYGTAPLPEQEYEGAPGAEYEHGGTGPVVTPPVMVKGLFLRPDGVSCHIRPDTSSYYLRQTEAEPPPAATAEYLRPDGVACYLRPDGMSQYLRIDEAGAGGGNGGDAASDAIYVQALVVSDYAKQRTAILCDGLRLLALGHGSADRIDEEQREIYSAVETRGYVLAEIGEKTILAAETFYATRAATVSMNVRTDGVNEVLPLVEARRRNRQRYVVHGKLRYDLSNRANNHGAPHREDYAWVAADAMMMMSGVKLNALQEWKHPLPLRRFGRWFSVRVESTTGQIRLLGVQVDCLPERNVTHARG